MLLLSLKNDWQPLLFESGRCENSFVDYKINYKKLCYSLQKIWTGPLYTVIGYWTYWNKIRNFVIAEEKCSGVNLFFGNEILVIDKLF